MSFNVTIIGDKVKESGNETFQVNLGNSTNATIGTGSATVTIVDDERALTAAEGANSETQSLVAPSAEAIRQPPPRRECRRLT